MSTSFNDTDEDLQLPQRRPASASERAVNSVDPGVPDREVTLNTGTVLALFFSLALLCAVFFGLGYSMGRKSNVAASSAATTDTADATPSADTGSTTLSSSKPSPGSPAGQSVPGYMPQTEAASAGSAHGGSQTTPTTVVVHTDAAPVVRIAPAQPAVQPGGTAPKPAAAPVVRAAPAPVPPPAPATTAPASSVPDASSTYVQIAAVSHQEDADVLLSALRRRGYKVVTRSDANDKLIHVQIGPFSTRKDAEATRQKLLGDGYNAFLK